MKIDRLTLENFRNYETGDVVLKDGVNVFIGENAQGKTNALEAIYFLAMGKSHRTAKDSECILSTADKASVRGEITVKGNPHVLQVEITPNGKRASVNGVSQSKMTDFLGHFQVVLFAPEDLQLVKGSPGVRRRFIDMELGQTHPKYLYHLTQYNHVLQQRNTLLKQSTVDWDYIAVFDEQLAEHGAEVTLRRRRFIEEMKKYARDIHENIARGRESLHIAYQPSIRALDDGAPDSVKALTDHYLGLLHAKRQQDFQTGHTTVGPHRDDMVFFIDDKPVQSFASQGQQRTVALSIRLAEIEFIYHEVGDYPVLLLDDVLSELDDHRQTNLVISMHEKVQTIITTTSLAPFHGMLEGQMRLFHVHSGIITG
ncbi:DNA replication/repair protein RecF [Alicyclobacillus curvatus]|nr:DNA replication/repair protein RecF [Alicyclobacillus curvatus]